MDEDGDKNESKVDHLDVEEDQAGVDFGRSTLAIINSDAETSPYSPTFEEGVTNNPGADDQTPVDPSASFFATRTGAFESAVAACRPVILPNIDGEFRGAWLLTEIDHWDTEKERIVFLTQLSLLIIKYDFIALKVLDYKRLPVVEFDRIIRGNFTYPEASVVPKVGRMVDMVKGLVFNWTTSRSRKPPSVAKPGALCVHSTSKRRSSKGIRAMWNKGRPINTKESWNPWSRAIPYVTMTSHPYASMAPDSNSAAVFSVEHFGAALVRVIEQLIETARSNCIVEDQPILIDSYLGLVAMFHNENNLGFFKLRGKVSF